VLVVQEKAGAYYTYSYNGLEWGNTFEKCRGQRQSPVMLPVTGAAASRLEQPDAKSSFSYGTLTDPKIVNNGHTLQVSLPADFQSDVKIPIKGEDTSSSRVSEFEGL
jgi:carbonic anhydrase